MPKLAIQRTVSINAPVDKIFNTLNDFNHWTAWSPWLIMDPKAKVTVREDAKHYTWEGERVGSGNMTVLNEEAGKRIDYDLMFLKPWKSQAKVSFIFNENGDETDVTWTMDSSLPFFMFWMKKMTEAFVGMDYERGLNMLKDYIEKGAVPSHLDFKGESQYDGFKYVGVAQGISRDNVGPQMELDFTSLYDFFKDKEDQIAGQPFSIYKKWDMVNNRVEYISGIPVKSIPDNLPNTFVTGEIPSSRVYELHHKGPYQHLGNAWTTMHNMARGKAFKANKKISPWEVYHNDPAQTAPEDLETSVFFALK